MCRAVQVEAGNLMMIPSRRRYQYSNIHLPREEALCQWIHLKSKICLLSMQRHHIYLALQNAFVYSSETICVDVYNYLKNVYSSATVPSNTQLRCYCAKWLTFN
jgi:hypothetical protein